MSQQDWIDYFEAVNGRSPEPSEIEAARQAGEFSEDISEIIPEMPEHTNHLEEAEVPVQVQPQVEQQPQVEPQSQPQPEPIAANPVQATGYQQTVPPVNATPQPQSQQVAQQRPVQFEQGPSNGDQQVYTMQVAVPSAFSIFWKQFWIWLKTSWKRPTMDRPTHKYNGLTVIGLVVLFTTLTITIPLLKAGWLSFSNFISVFLGFSFIYVAFIIAGFVVKLIVYKEKKFTFGYSFEWFGRLVSLNVPLMAFAALFSLLDVYSLSVLLTVLSYFIFVAASGYTLYHRENHSNLDMFYKYIIASVLFSIIVFIFMMVAGSIAGEMILNSLTGNFNSFVNYYSPFGY
ncbi:DUF6574 domain-containing protein [Streptococcus moroccensis]|uniref:Response regulator (Homolog to RR11 Spn) n=1 Tax=Streptococcus moroccensis TaxID=1451356 RepID=A0ABT9YT96_9STRE|nr:DUF6574 domain-containing protein [Streptococcus moroccensis]MDQ0223112.1 hypothetical protein [Streptococcus moroccensis]